MGLPPGLHGARRDLTGGRRARRARRVGRDHRPRAAVVRVQSPRAGAAPVRVHGERRDRGRRVRRSPPAGGAHGRHGVPRGWVLHVRRGLRETGGGRTGVSHGVVGD